MTMVLWQQLMLTLFIHHQVIATHNKTHRHIRLLHVFLRNGESVPQKSVLNYPNDPHLNYSYFPVDDGGLSNVGKHRMYEIGKSLRKKYGQFFGDYYIPSEIFARATHRPCTQMSLQLVLAGLYPPVKKQIWNHELFWQPISSFYVPNAEDFLFTPTKCSLNVDATHEADQLNNTLAVLAKYKSHIEYISYHSGKPITALYDALTFYNLFNEQKAHNLTLPVWTHKVYPKLLQEMAIAYLNLRSYTQKLRRYNGGFLVYEIIKNTNLYRDGTLKPANRKAFFYSGYDFNIMALGKTFGLNYPVYPKYGTTFIIETLEDGDGHYYIRIILWGGLPHQVLNLRLPNCEEPCPIEHFLELYSNIIPTQTEYDLCRRETLTFTDSIY